MSSYTITNYNCDNCGDKILCNSSLNITTSKSESNINWSRLHVKIINEHGSHNDYKEEDANLCQKCAIKLLNDALKRVKKGERASAGTEKIDCCHWNE